MPFPPHFVWGVAASSYQIEGAASEDGRGASIWDTFCAKPGAVWSNHSGAVACDHYHRMQSDVALMQSLGVRAYRLSIAWPRVMPAGTGAVNAPGLTFYGRLIDALLAANITPYVTLFHWDYPQALFDRGGWLNPDSPLWFADYTRVVVDALSDRVQHWMTLNEPQVFLKFGHADAINAPGLSLALRDQLVATHHALLAHGLSVQEIRARAKRPPLVGYAPVCVVKYPATRSAEDIGAARSLTCGFPDRTLWNNPWFNDPIFLGQYPDDGLRLFAPDVPEFSAHDLRHIHQPLDFLGLNIYEGQPVRAGASGKAVPVERPVGHPTTAFRWPVEPESLHWGPRFMHERYKVPIYITENGLSNIDWVSLDGKVHDPQRIDFTRRYLFALRDAIDAGVDIRGYFHWSFMDNFEWAAGYKERFGLIHVDFTTQARVPKDSAYWYKRVMDTNGAALDAHP